MRIMADGQLELEWDSEDSNLYQDGREAGEADALAARPYDDRGMSGPEAEGYRDGYEDTLTPEQARRRDFRVSLRTGGSSE
jgi:hypothetical protein